MSTKLNRVVPLVLREGMEYITREGKQVLVQANPHWQLQAAYQFAAMEGSEWVYYKDDGSTDLHEQTPHDLIRPVYKAGFTYATENGTGVTLSECGSDCCSVYPFKGSNGFTFTATGELYVDIGTEPRNLLDYAAQPIPNLTVEAPLLTLGALRRSAIEKAEESSGNPLPVLEEVKNTHVGCSVRCNITGMEGVVVSQDGECLVVEIYKTAPDCHNLLHDCDGKLPDRNGWYMTVSNATIIEEQTTPTTGGILTDADRSAIWNVLTEVARRDAVDYTTEVQRIIAARRLLNKEQ